MNVEMMIDLVRLAAGFLTWIVIASALLSFFLPPYHPVREALDRIVDPLLRPIRQVIPPAGMMDFSPLILILAIELLSRLFVSILINLS